MKVKAFQLLSEYIITHFAKITVFGQQNKSILHKLGK